MRALVLCLSLLACGRSSEEPASPDMARCGARYEPCCACDGGACCVGEFLICNPFNGLCEPTV